MFPLIAGLAGSLGSMFFNQSAASKVAEARLAAVNAERERQKAFDAETAVFNTRSQDRYTGFGGQQTDRGKQLGDYFASAPTTGGPTAAVPTTKSDLVSREIGDQLAKSKAYGTQQGNALADVRSFGDLMGTIGRSQARDAGYIGQIGGFKKGSASITPYELEAASHAGDKQKMWADIIGGIGKIGGMFGGGGSFTGLGNMFMPSATNVSAFSNPLAYNNPYWGGGANGSNSLGMW